MKKQLVSIIVPCYNQAQYLDECLESIISQTYPNWECIIVNDGSPDNTNEIAEKWCRKDSRIRYFQKENGGVSSARNYGISHSLGEFILPVDADDKIGPDFIMLALSRLNDNIKVVNCKVCFFGERKGIYNLPDYSLKKLALGNIIVCTALYRKTDWKRIGGYDENMEHGMEDWEFWLHLLKDGGDVFQIDSIQFFYRIKKKSRNADLKSNKEKIKRIYDYVTAKYAFFYFDLFGNPIENYLTLNRRILIKIITIYNSLKTFFKYIGWIVKNDSTDMMHKLK
jgi:glycosyltransferase involved in cell wall biosynthesis